MEELPADASEVEAKESLEPTISEMSQEIEQRQARRQREAQKGNLIREGVAEVAHYLWRLKQDGEIFSEDYWDTDFRTELQDTFRKELESELSGEETASSLGLKCFADTPPSAVWRDHAFHCVEKRVSRAEPA